MTPTGLDTRRVTVSSKLGVPWGQRFQEKLETSGLWGWRFSFERNDVFSGAEAIRGVVEVLAARAADFAVSHPYGLSNEASYHEVPREPSTV